MKRQLHITYRKGRQYKQVKLSDDASTLVGFVSALELLGFLPPEALTDGYVLEHPGSGETVLIDMGRASLLKAA